MTTTLSLRDDDRELYLRAAGQSGDMWCVLLYTLGGRQLSGGSGYPDRCRLSHDSEGNVLWIAGASFAISEAEAEQIAELGIRRE